MTIGSHFQSPNSPLWWNWKYATAIVPELSSAAIRVPRPTAISTPATSSITPPIQPWLPTSGVGRVVSQPNTFCRPWQANIAPATIRSAA